MGHYSRVWGSRYLLCIMYNAQADLSLRCPHEESLDPERSAKTLVILLVLSRGGSYKEDECFKSK